MRSDRRPIVNVHGEERWIVGRYGARQYRGQGSVAIVAQLEPCAKGKRLREFTLLRWSTEDS